MMAKRVTSNVQRAAPVHIRVDDALVEAYPGETLATALMAAGRPAFSRNWNGRMRGLVCNMGVCFECVVEVRRGGAPGDEYLPLRACMTRVEDGMTIRTSPGGG